MQIPKLHYSVINFRPDLLHLIGLAKQAEIEQQHVRLAEASLRSSCPLLSLLSLLSAARSSRRKRIRRPLPGSGRQHCSTGSGNGDDFSQLCRSDLVCLRRRASSAHSVFGLVQAYRQERRATAAARPPVS